MSAVAELSANALMPASAVKPALGGRFAQLDRAKRLRLAIGAVLLVAVAIAAVLMGRQSDWRVLFTNLGDKDGGAVIAQLAQLQVPYKFTEGGAAIMVPADRVHDVRFKLAALGLPKGSVAGFEQMDGSNRFGMTQFQEKLSFQRGLEGELTRSIQSLGAVQSARVHLALPNQNGFFREQQKPSASVLLTLYPGRVLDRNQIAGIVHLVASSVPDLAPTAVSIVDDSGKLLSTTGADTTAGAVDAQQLQYQQQLEAQYTRRLLDILEPVVGRNNVKAQVTADLDFSQSEATSEEHKPNLAQDQSAVRSQQTVESVGAAAGAAAPAGVPGAASNTPPGPSSAPINGQAAPLSPAAPQAPAPGAAGPSKRESTINYEVDKTVRTVRSATGQVRRLSAAVVINYQNVVDAQGKATPTALSPQQVEQLTALVRETIGFNQKRGDTVNLMNTPFLVEASAAVPELPVWRRPETIETAKGFAWPAGMVILGLVVFFGLVRPSMKAVLAPPPNKLQAEAVEPGEPGGALSAVVNDTPERPALGAPDSEAAAAAVAAALPSPEETVPEQARLEGARQMARQNPVAVANIVKTWVHG